GLREYARTIEGKEQLAVAAYADALEGIPRAIAQNAGFHPLDALVALRAGHARGGERIGFDARDGKTKDAYAAGIIDPAVVKRQALKSASEAAIMLLRIDDVLVAQGFVEGRMEPPMEEGPVEPEI
ncbi:MAG: TCP-1/cpn60 chaperonin family protein, partial [Candidatus Hydrothermarchaeota archaeon]